jgi:uncharacterized membrane protein
LNTNQNPAQSRYIGFFRIPKVIIIGFIEFFILRNINRHVFADELYIALNVSQIMNVMTSVFFGLQALLLAYLLWRTSRDEKRKSK